MTGNERRATIVTMLEARGRVSIAEVSRLTEVSEMTIRRDLEALEHEGILKRTHGGAVSVISLSYEPPYIIRKESNRSAKSRIAQRASEMLSEGETVILDVGTTAVAIAQALKARVNLTVLTSNLWAAAILADEKGIVLMVTGGTARARERSLVGSLATRAFSDLVFDVFFLSVAGVHPEFGITDYNMEEAQVKREAIRAAQRRIVVADSSKLGKVAFAKICGLDQIDMIITDNEAPEEIAALKSAGIEMVLV